MPKTNAKKPSKTTSPPSRARSTQTLAYRLRRSPVHGTGLFATRKIAKGEEIIEYAGERISHAEADRRHAKKDADDNHTFLFTIDARTVVDGGVGGNDARFINHSCDPNCEVVIDDGRLLVEAVRTVSSGEELAYDYNLTRADDDEPEIERLFACRCGAAVCRGTMLAPHKKPKAATAKKAKAEAKASSKPKAKASSKAKAKAKASAKGKASASTKGAGGVRRKRAAA